MAKKITSPDWGHFVWWPTVTILSFDQALAKTGWALVDFAPNRRPDVIAVGTLVTEPHDGLSGIIDSLVRAENLHKMIGGVIESFASIDFAWVVHESPSVMSKMSTKREGGPLSALAVRIAANRADIAVQMVDARHAKKWMTGNPNAEKAQMQESVKAALGVDKLHFRTNEHIWDAIGLAMAHVLDLLEQ